MKITIEIPDEYKKVLHGLGRVVYGTNTYKQTCEICVLHNIKSFEESVRRANEMFEGKEQEDENGYPEGREDALGEGGGVDGAGDVEAGQALS